jgi:arginyl-tRNA synthetase
VIRAALIQHIQTTIQTLVDAGSLPAEILKTPVEIEPPKQAEHGDFATNFCLVATKSAGLNPRALAELLRPPLSAPVERGPGGEVFQSVEIAGPGFINFRLNPAWAAQFLQPILDQPSEFYKPKNKNPQRINVEHVSVNPNGPITIGSGRGAAFGSSICNILEAAGHTVHREYYINDGVNSEQMRLFAESVKAIIEGRPVPENGYKGDYVHEIGAQLKDLPTSDILQVQKACEGKMIAAQHWALQKFQTNFDTWFSEQSLHDSGEVESTLQQLLTTKVADDQPTRTKVVFAKGGIIKEVVNEAQPNDDDSNPTEEEGSDLPPLRENGEGDRGGEVAASKTIWLRSTKFGDDQDRVLKRKDGRLTYIASDVAYHKDKFNRPADADKLITVLGPDHHGYIARLTAVVAAMFSDQVEPLNNPEPLTDHDALIYSSIAERNQCQAALAWAKHHLEVQIFQLVRFLKDGKPAPMRKRDGNIYALIDLINEIGATLKPNGSTEEKQQAGSDVARFFYLMRHHDTAMDFDLELATRQSDENPVFYVQYAHARICSVIDKAAETLEFHLSASGERGLEGGIPLTSGKVAERANLELLTHPKETALILKICDLQNDVARTADDYSVNRIATYTIELARTYHSFYDSCRVIQPDQPELSYARVALCQATRVALKAALDLLGVSAPNRMERSSTEP